MYDPYILNIFTAILINKHGVTEIHSNVCRIKITMTLAWRQQFIQGSTYFIKVMIVWGHKWEISNVTQLTISTSVMILVKSAVQTSEYLWCRGNIDIQWLYTCQRTIPEFNVL